MNRMLQKIRTITKDERELFIYKIGQRAFDLQILHGNCSRCTLLALQEHLSLGGDESYRASQPLSGGVAGNLEICGALLGGLLVIGLAYGNNKVDLDRGCCSEDLQQVRTLSNQVYDGFAEKFGGTRCSDVQKALHGRTWDLRDPQMYAEFMRSEIHDRCGDVAEVAAELVARVILCSA